MFRFLSTYIPESRFKALVKMAVYNFKYSYEACIVDLALEKCTFSAK